MPRATCNSCSQGALPPFLRMAGAFSSFPAQLKRPRQDSPGHGARHSPPGHSSGFMALLSHPRGAPHVCKCLAFSCTAHCPLPSRVGPRRKRLPGSLPHGQLPAHRTTGTHTELREQRAGTARARLAEHSKARQRPRLDTDPASDSHTTRTHGAQEARGFRSRRRLWRRPRSSRASKARRRPRAGRAAKAGRGGGRSSPLVRGA